MSFGRGSSRGIARTLGVGGFTDPEIDSIDAGKLFRSVKDETETLALKTVLVWGVKTRKILSFKYQNVFNLMLIKMTFSEIILSLIVNGVTFLVLHSFRQR